MQIGIDSFSYHRYFGEHTPWEQPLTERWQVADFLARAGSLGVSDVSLQTVYLPPFDDGFARELRDLLRQFRLRPTLAWGHPDGLQGGASPEKVEVASDLLPWAAALGCSVVRIVCGNQFTFRLPVHERAERLAPILRRLSAEAAEWGLTLAVENHADFHMRDLVDLLQQVRAANLGICFDSGNAVRVGDDLMQALDLALPYIRMVHLKDIVVIPESVGDPAKWWPSAPLGAGDFDIPALLGRLRSSGYEGGLFVEMANMHPRWPDEDQAVAESVAYLRRWQASAMKPDGPKSLDNLV